MNAFTGVIVYLMIWWTMLFAVLPWGVRRHDETVDGADPGAPQVPLLKQKLIATTLVSALMWCLVAFLMEIEIISFHDRADVLAERSAAGN